MKSNNYLYSITPFWLLLSPWVYMSFQQQLASELNEIINDVEKDKGRSRTEAEVLWDLSLIESNHLNCVGSLEIVDTMNQACQHLRILLYGEQSFICFENYNFSTFYEGFLIIKKERIKKQNNLLC